MTTAAATDETLAEEQAEALRHAAGYACRRCDAPARIVHRAGQPAVVVGHRYGCHPSRRLAP